MEFNLTILPLNGHMIPKKVVSFSINAEELINLRDHGHVKFADGIEEFITKELKNASE